MSHPQLERVKQIFLTDKGKRLLAESEKLINAVEMQSLAQLDPDEVQALRMMLQKYIAAIEEADT